MGSRDLLHATLITRSGNCLGANQRIILAFNQSFGIESVALLWHLSLKKETCIEPMEIQGLTLWGSNSFHATLITRSGNCLGANQRIILAFNQSFGIESVALLWHLSLKKETCIDLIVIHYISTRDKTFRVTLGTHSCIVAAWLFIQRFGI